MAAPAGLTEGSVPEPTEPEPPEPDPTPEAAEAADTGDTADAADAGDAGDAGDTGEENALAVADPEPDPEPDPEQPASGTGPARGTSRLAVAAVIFGLIVLAGAAVGALAVATHGFRPKTVIQYHLAAVFSLRPGDCLNSSPNGLSVTVLSCATPHDGEVFATFSLTAPSWPGDAAVQSEANSGCLSRIAGYVGPQLANAGLAQEYFYPDQAAWQAGVRTVVCEVRASTGQLTGSVRDLG
jgi:Septum formation